MSAGHVFTIAPHAPFLETLADRVLDGTLLNGWPRTGPFWLSDVTIILPTRRARLALAERFMAQQGGRTLLPDIRTFGGEPGDEEPFLPPHDAPDLPAAASPQERQLALARLIDAWARTADGAAVLATPPNPAEILALAASLGELIDDLAIENVRYEAVKSLPPDAYAENWQQSLKFLDVALAYWPQYLAARGKLDAFEHRNLRLRRQAETAHVIYGDRPVIAAGSTGSIPATAALLKAIVALPRGALVLPGLDTSLTAGEHEKLLNENAAPHGHPQYALGKLLRRLGTGPAAFIELATESNARTTLVRQAFAPAAATAWWITRREELKASLPDAVTGLATIAAHNADEEARAIALCAREALSTGKTVGIVSPDQNLSRRIAAELKRFDIEVDDPAGTPLYQSPAGRLARLLLAVCINRCAPVELIALLRHPGAGFGLAPRDVGRLVDRLELCLLRGQRPRPSIEGLRLALAANAEAERGPRLNRSESGEIAMLLDRLEAALAPLAAVLAARTVTAPALANAISLSLGATLAGSSLPGAEEIATWVTTLAGHEDQGPPLPAYGLDAVLRVLIEGQTVRRRERRRDDIFIWGQLEARLQNPGLIILAGLNEGVWPPVADAGPWLSRGMRLALGLEPAERRQGQGAHDFEMALGNPEAVMAFAARLGTTPALPSRFIQRFEAFIGTELTETLRSRGARWIAGARAIDVADGLAAPVVRPVPRPAAEMRPRKLSITEVETLFRSPYDIYAKHVLGLHKLAPLGEEPEARERGIMVHEVFARFVEEGCDFAAPDALLRLNAFATEAFAGLDAIPERRAIWLKRFEVAAAQFLAHERLRQPGIAMRNAELKGEWAMPNGFTLTGRADRIDLLHDGTAEILDFKTGSLPSVSEMQSFLAPQLPLEAAMLKAGAFGGVASAATSAMTFIKIGLGPSAFIPSGFRSRGTPMQAADGAAQHLAAHVDALLLRDTLPMAAQVLPKPNRRYRGDYDHLARIDEWAVAEGDESE